MKYRTLGKLKLKISEIVLGAWAIGVSVPDNTPENVIGSLVKGKVAAVQLIYHIFEQHPQYNILPVCEKLGIGYYTDSL